MWARAPGARAAAPRFALVLWDALGARAGTFALDVPLDLYENGMFLPGLPQSTKGVSSKTRLRYDLDGAATEFTATSWPAALAAARGMRALGVPFEVACASEPSQCPAGTDGQMFGIQVFFVDAGTGASQNANNFETQTMAARFVASNQGPFALARDASTLVAARARLICDVADAPVTAETTQGGFARDVHLEGAADAAACHALPAPTDAHALSQAPLFVGSGLADSRAFVHDVRTAWIDISNRLYFRILDTADGAVFAQSAADGTVLGAPLNPAWDLTGSVSRVAFEPALGRILVVVDDAALWALDPWAEGPAQLLFALPEDAPAGSTLGARFVAGDSGTVFQLVFLGPGAGAGGEAQLIALDATAAGDAAPPLSTVVYHDFVMYKSFFAVLPADVSTGGSSSSVPSDGTSLILSPTALVIPSAFLAVQVARGVAIRQFRYSQLAVLCVYLLASVQWVATTIVHLLSLLPFILLGTACGVVLAQCLHFLISCFVQ
jgi:hypothetical protein